ncbi:MAG: sigma-70 family RNA polymerase sigma factor [Cytophagales bacterium]|nr:MAG: sigma-70 family RNA polymerase sigma factor [Cytophagales bacterium]
MYAPTIAFLFVRFQLIVLRHFVFSSAYHKSEDEIRAEYEIVQKAKMNPQFFAPLYEKYYDSIFIYISRRIDDEELTADMTAQVFYKCLRSLEKYDFQGVPFSAWLFRIAINEINQFFKQQKNKERSVSLKEKHINILFEELQHHDVKDKHDIVIKLLEQLDSDDVQFVELRFFEGRSFKEIGFLLGLTEVNAKVKTYRILAKLKEYAEKLLR